MLVINLFPCDLSCSILLNSLQAILHRGGCIKNNVRTMIRITHDYTGTDTNLFRTNYRIQCMVASRIYTIVYDRT